MVPSFMCHFVNTDMPWLRDMSAQPMFKVLQSIFVNSADTTLRTAQQISYGIVVQLLRKQEDHLLQVLE